jgi:hypothetical protein
LQLSRDGQWRSQESLSFHALRYNKIVGCYHREYPMGWAALSTQGSQRSLVKDRVDLPDFSRQVFWRWARQQPSGSSLSQIFGRSSEVNWTSRGLGQYATLSKEREKKPVRIAVKVSQRLDSHAVISSTAIAQTYFFPPTQQPLPLARRQAVTPSLFEPYWRATLIPEVATP